MSKKLSLLILSPLLFSFTSCSSCSSNKAIINKTKELMEVIKNNGVNKNSFTMVFAEKYHEETHIDNEYEKSDSVIDYEAMGSFISAFVFEDGYSFNPDDYHNVLEHSHGYFNNQQREIVEYNSIEIDKDSNTTTTTSTNYIYTKDFEIKYDDNTFYSDGDYKYNDVVDSSNDAVDNIGAKIDKQVLLKNASNDIIDQFFSRLIIIPSYNDFNKVHKLCSQGIYELDLTNDEAVEKYINDHSLKIEDDGNTIVMSYIVSDEYNKNINVVYEFNSINKMLVDFVYDLKFYYDVMLKEKDANSYVEQYMISGNFFDVNIDEIPLDPEVEFINYTDANIFMGELYNHASKDK